MPDEHVIVDLSLPASHPDRERRVVGVDKGVMKAQMEQEAHTASIVAKAQARTKAIEALSNHDDPALKALAEHL